MRFITHSKTRLYPPMAALSGLSGILPDAGVADDAGSIPILSLTAGFSRLDRDMAKEKLGSFWHGYALLCDEILSS
jgi:hypothetical protein